MSFHGKFCTIDCKLQAVPSPLERDRPPMVDCPWCGAPAGIACYVASKPRAKLRTFGRFHPSRMEAA